MNTNDGTIYPTVEQGFQAGVPRSYLMAMTPTERQARRMKVGRNDLCPCGSGKKFKKCHLGKPVSP